MPHVVGNFKIDERARRYSDFIPRFYNLCLSYGFEPGKIMPSRAFCSDESQGYPIILIAKHFGAFPFNHGQVGGIVASNRHGAHSLHGKDLVIIQASHVGYDPETHGFGAYRRLQFDSPCFSTSCGKICDVLNRYQLKYAFAQNNISFSHVDGEDVIVIDNLLLDANRSEGLFLRLDQLIDMKQTPTPSPVHVFSTSKAYRPNPKFKSQLPDDVWQENQREPIGKRLTADFFIFKRDIPVALEGNDHLEHNLSQSMPRIVTAPCPELIAAQSNTQIEFDRTYRTIITEQGYRGKNLAFIAGLNIDISPQEGQLFPLTKFVPWAAYIQTSSGQQIILEPRKLTEALNAQSTENKNKIDLEKEIQTMAKMPGLSIQPPR